MYTRGYVSLITLAMILLVIAGVVYFLGKNMSLSVSEDDVLYTAGVASSTASSTHIIIGNVAGTSTRDISEVTPTPRATPNVTPANQTSAPQQSPTTVTSQRASTQTSVVQNPIRSISNSSGDITVRLLNNGTMWRVGETYTIEWEPNSSIRSRSYNDFKVELIEVGRIDVGPVLIATYPNEPIRSIPRRVGFTLPRNMDTDTWYAVKVSYKTSNDNYFGDAGYKGLEYTGTSPSFRIVENRDTTETRTTSSGGVLTLTSQSVNVPNDIHEQSRNVPLVRARAQAKGSPITLTHLAVGSPTGNEVFNYIENVKAEVNGRRIGMAFSNEYLLGTTLWKFDEPVYVNEGDSVTITLVADIKPGIRDMDLRAVISGGRANGSVEGRVVGPTVSVD